MINGDRLYALRINVDSDSKSSQSPISPASEIAFAQLKKLPSPAMKSDGLLGKIANSQQSSTNQWVQENPKKILGNLVFEQSLADNEQAQKEYNGMSLVQTLEAVGEALQQFIKQEMPGQKGNLYKLFQLIMEAQVLLNQILPVGQIVGIISHRSQELSKEATDAILEDSAGSPEIRRFLETEADDLLEKAQDVQNKVATLAKPALGQTKEVLGSIREKIRKLPLNGRMLLPFCYYSTPEESANGTGVKIGGHAAVLEIIKGDGGPNTSAHRSKCILLNTGEGHGRYVAKEIGLTQKQLEDVIGVIIDGILEPGYYNSFNALFEAILGHTGNHWIPCSDQPASQTGGTCGFSCLRAWLEFSMGTDLFLRFNRFMVNLFLTRYRATLLDGNMLLPPSAKSTADPTNPADLIAAAEQRLKELDGLMNAKQKTPPKKRDTRCIVQ